MKFVNKRECLWPLYGMIECIERERMYFNVKQKFVFDLYDYIYIWKMNGIFLIKFKFDFLSIFNRETEIKN